MERSSGKLKMCVWGDGEGFLQFPTKWDFQCGEMKWNSLNPTKEKLILAESECMCDKSNCLQGVHFEGGGKRFGFKNRRKLLLSAGTRTWSWQNRDFFSKHTHICSFSYAAETGLKSGGEITRQLRKEAWGVGWDMYKFGEQSNYMIHEQEEKVSGKEAELWSQKSSSPCACFSSEATEKLEKLGFSAFGPHHYRLRKDGGRMYRVSLNFWPTQKVYVKEGTSGSRLNN